MFNIETDAQADNLFKEATSHDILEQPFFKLFLEFLKNNNEVERYSAEIFKTQVFKEISLYFLGKSSKQTSPNDYIVLGK